VFWSFSYIESGDKKVLDCFVPEWDSNKLPKADGWGTNISEDGGSYSPFTDWTPELIDEFNKCIFEIVESKEEGVDLSNLYFPGDIDFSELKFSNLQMKSSNFNGDAIFRESCFIGAAYFHNTTFSKKADFFACTFSQYTNFSCCTFFGLTFFSKSTFGSNLNFSHARFCKSTSFSKCLAAGEADFSSITSNENIDFSSFQGEDQITFDYSSFSGTAAFGKMRICGNAGFSNIDFKNITYFNFSSFEGDFVLFNTRFFASVYFSFATFRKETVFDSCKFEEAVDFHDVKFLCFDSTQQSSYRILRNKMKALGNRYAEGMFFVLEEKCKRRIPKYGGSKVRKLFKTLEHLSFSAVSFLYDIFSLYGMSIWRPVVWLFSSSMLFAGYYFYKVPEVAGSRRSALLYSWQQIVKPFQVSVNHHLNDFNLIWVVTSFQSLLSIALFSLFILGLRWRFKQG
jgi:uncharacterized protein YjbI with pentapeptide repeats